MRQNKYNLFGNVQRGTGSKTETCLYGSEVRKGSEKTININNSEAKITVNIFAATMKDVVEDASALHTDTLTDFTTKIENGVSAFYACLEIFQFSTRSIARTSIANDMIFPIIEN